MRKKEILAEMLYHLRIAAGLLILLAVFFAAVWLCELAVNRWPVPMVVIGFAGLVTVCWGKWRADR